MAATIALGVNTSPSSCTLFFERVSSVLVEAIIKPPWFYYELVSVGVGISIDMSCHQIVKKSFQLVFVRGSG